MNNLLGKHIWLIGASEGIGRALAIELADQGAILSVSARNSDKLHELLQSISGLNNIALPLDVTDRISINQAWKDLLSIFPKLDMIIYNAGSYEPMDSQHFNYEKVEQIFDVNILGALKVMDLVLPYFIKNNFGHIALVGSVAGYRGLPSSIGYGASKAALIHFAENLKADLYNSKIKVQVFNPGFVKTRLTAKNNFKMPSIIEPQDATKYIVKGLKGNSFETHFPKSFTYILKLLSLLPYSIYFWIINKITKTS